MAVESIHRWLGEAAGLGFVPVPLAALDGRTLHERGGRLWDVSPWLTGVSDSDVPPGPSRLRAGFAALAAFHQSLRSDRTRGPSPGLNARLREFEALLGGGFTSLDGVVDRASGDPLAPLAARWLTLARWTAPRLVGPLRRDAGRVVALQPCLRDARPEHVLFEGDRVTGLVDFGAMGIESVAADLARLLTAWVGPDRAARAEALRAYAAVRPLDDPETALMDAFGTTSAVLGAGHWVRWHFAEGRAFEDPGAVERGIRLGLDRLAELTATR